jgi:hypothetical protein
MIKDSKKIFYHGCAAQYTRLFVMLKLFYLKASNRWNEGSFKDLLTLHKNILPQGNAISDTVYEVKQIICLKDRIRRPEVGGRLNERQSKFSERT